MDQYEELIGTDPNNPDTDGDGLSNLQEKEHATAPTNLDTDADGLTDGEEVRISTDPLRADSDEDGLSDTDEIKFSLDPLNPDTYHDGIPDGNRVFEQTKENNDAMDEYGISASVTLDVKASDAESLRVEKVEADDLFLCTEVPGFIGNAFEFRYDGDIETATLTFDFPQELLSQPDFVPAIYYWNEDEQLLEELPDQVVTGNSVSASVTHFSRYILLNKTDFDKVWEREIKALDPDGNVRKPTDMVLVIDSSGSMSSNDRTGIRKETSKRLVDKLKDNDQGAVVDFDSYSYLKAPLSNDKTVLKSAIDTIDSSSGTAIHKGFQTALDQFGVIAGKPSSRSATEELNIPELFNEGIDTQEAPQADGREESAVMAASAPETRDAHRFIIILSDGQDGSSGNYNTLVQEAIDKDIKVFTIGLGSGVNTALLQTIATATGGRYYHATVAGDLDGIFDDLADDVVLVDEDNDKLFDYYETTGIRLGSGRTIYTDPKNPDTDGDGLLDGEELELRLSADKKTVIYFKFHSDPTKKDSDDDGLLDNAPTIIGGKTITPKDPAPVSPEPMKKVWQAEIAQARAGNVQSSYQSNAFDKASEFIDYIWGKYDLETNHNDQNIKQLVGDAIDLALSNKQLITDNREALTSALSGIKQLLNYVTAGERSAKVAADIGAFILNFRMDEKSVAYHAKPDTWQKEFGYNDLIDEIFGIVSSMRPGKLYFNYNGKQHLVWAWRGDYWLLGGGAEMGVYSFTREVNGIAHYDAVDFTLPMTMSLYSTRSGRIEHCFSWYPTEKQWWVTGFNYRYPNVDAGQLASISSIDFSSYPYAYAQVKNAHNVDANKRLSGSKRLLDYSIFDDANKTVWFMWYG